MDVVGDPNIRQLYEIAKAVYPRVPNPTTKLQLDDIMTTIATEHLTTATMMTYNIQRVRAWFRALQSMAPYIDVEENPKLLAAQSFVWKTLEAIARAKMREGKREEMQKM
jgi:phytoene/squalene synthetase